MGLSDFINSVADPFRGATTASNIPHVSGSGYQSPHPAQAAWLDLHQEVRENLSKVSSAVAVLEGNHEGMLIGFNKAHEHLDETRAAEARLHHDARELGKAADPELAKRALRARQSAMAANEEAAARAALASNACAHTREALNTAVKFVGHHAAEHSDVRPAQQVSLPEGIITDVISAERRTIADLNVEKSNVESAYIPLEDAIEMVRSRIGGESPRIILGPQTAEWTPPLQPLNVAPQLGNHPVEVVNSTALIEWLFGDVLADRLEELVRIRYAGVERTFTPAERRKALADIEARRMKAERVEVTAIFAAWASGNYVPLRPDTSPMALLGIAEVTEGVKEPADYVGSAFLGVGTAR